MVYIQDVLALCQQVNDRMSEADKVSHILKGIANDAFHLLVYEACSTIDDIIMEYNREEAKSRRVMQQFVQLFNTAGRAKRSHFSHSHRPLPIISLDEQILMPQPRPHLRTACRPRTTSKVLGRIGPVVHRPCPSSEN